MLLRIIAIIRRTTRSNADVAPDGQPGTVPIRKRAIGAGKESGVHHSNNLAEDMARLSLVQNATMWCSENSFHGILSSGYSCPSPGMCVSNFHLQHNEPFFNSLIGELLLSRSLPLGGIVDAGAHTGENACFYALLAPGRTVTAIEPNLDNVAAIRNRTRRLGNVNLMQAGLGAGNFTVLVRKEFIGTGRPGQKAGSQIEFGTHTMDHAKANPGDALPDDNVTSFQVHMIDDLYRAQRLGFAHLDVEGHEAQVLEGATKVIRRDRPVFTTEIHVHHSYATTANLMRRISQLGYRSYMVEGESCGVRADCRNLLNVPKEWASLPRFLDRHLMDVSRTRSSTTQQGYGTLVPSNKVALVLVNETSIFSQAHPCCRPWGPCCPDGPVPLQHAWNSTNRGYTCCVKQVAQYYAKVQRETEASSAQNMKLISLGNKMRSSGLAPRASQPKMGPAHQRTDLMGQPHHPMDPTQSMDLMAANAAIKQLVEAGFTGRSSEQLAWLSRQVSRQVRLRDAVGAALNAITASGISPGEMNQDEFLAHLAQRMKRGSRQAHGSSLEQPVHPTARHHEH